MSLVVPARSPAPASPFLVPLFYPDAPILVLTAFRVISLIPVVRLIPVFVPPAFAADAVLEGVDAGLELVVAITEGIPVMDMMRVKSAIVSSIPMLTMMMISSRGTTI